MTEREAKALLMEHLDDCLRVHADLVDPKNIGSIYDLQELSELHYYLKVEHEFTAAEVEALLEYQDPLDVARWCWEDNTHAHSFPICTLLKEIDADKRFVKFSGTISGQDKHTALMQKFDQSYFAYRENLMSMDKETLIEMAEEIAAMQEAYSYLTEQHYAFEDENLDDLLALDDPLKYFAERWPVPVSGVFEIDEDIRRDIDGIRESQEYLCREAQPSSVMERLQKAMKEVREYPATENHSRDPDAR